MHTPSTHAQRTHPPRTPVQPPCSVQVQQAAQHPAQDEGDAGLVQHAREGQLQRGGVRGGGVCVFWGGGGVGGTCGCGTQHAASESGAQNAVATASSCWLADTTPHMPRHMPPHMPPHHKAPHMPPHMSHVPHHMAPHMTPHMPPNMTPPHMARHHTAQRTRSATLPTSNSITISSWLLPGGMSEPW
jgi:hypothetical protein